MAGMAGNFDANQVAPKQVGDTHPVGKFPARISDTAIVENKEKTGGFLQVDFTTAAGSIPMRYNLWNQSAQAVEIAQGQLSALCHATGVFRVQFENEGAALRNANCQIEVVEQLDKERKPTGFTRVLKVYDAAGNEPGKPPAQQPAQQTTSQQPPMQQQPAGNRGAPQQGQQGATPAWGAPANNAPQQQPAQAPAQPAPAAWQQGQASPAPAQANSSQPPWAR